MVKSYFYLLANIIRSVGGIKKDRTKGIYRITTWKGGQVHKIIGIANALKVKELTVAGKINITDLYFIQHMDNLEILNLQNAIYLRRKKNEAARNRLRRNLVRKKKHLKEIWFPRSMRSVPPEMFKNCTELEHVILPDSVKIICSHAFSHSGIREVTIPASVRSVEPNAFDNCLRLEKIRVADSRHEIRWKGEQFRHCPALHEIYLGRNSMFEYALTTDADIHRLVVGKRVSNLNFDVRHTRDLVCLMKQPPHLGATVKAENFYVKRNFEHYWLHPEWNKKNITKL